MTGPKNPKDLAARALEDAFFLEQDRVPQGLCERLGPAERTQLKEELLRGTRGTAQAAGGFLGVGRVSAAEQQMIDALAASFG